MEQFVSHLKAAFLSLEKINRWRAGPNFKEWGAKVKDF